jgi:CPA1 family monovalent cation:H+ antiporter
LRSDWWSASRRRWDTSIRTSHGGGLRGAPALTLALSLPADLPLRDDILISAFAVVAFSVIVQGLTAPFACARSD